MKQDVDTLILGCTHYPLLASTIGRIAGERVRLVNPAYETARELKDLLASKKLLNEEAGKEDDRKYEFYVSDLADKFSSFAANILQKDSLMTAQVDIEEY